MQVREEARVRQKMQHERHYSPPPVGRPLIAEPAEPLNLHQEAKVQYSMMSHAQRINAARKESIIYNTTSKWERDYKVRRASGPPSSICPLVLVSSLELTWAGTAMSPLP